MVLGLDRVCLKNVGFKIGLLLYVLILASFFYSITTVVEMVSNPFTFTTLEYEKTKNVRVVHVETTLKKPTCSAFLQCIASLQS